MKKFKELVNGGKSPKKRYSLKEEIFNAITHGVGIVFSIVIVTILLVYAIWKKSTLSIVAFSIYGFSSIVLYTSSTLYHSFQKIKVKAILRIFDHASIFLLIAGTYTPVVLLAMDGAWRVGMLIAVWLIALSGIIFKILTFRKLDKYKVFSLAFYILMGWLVVIAIKPITQSMPLGFFIWFLAGGLVYSLGTIFYSLKKIPYNHGIWHLFVLGGSVLHFVGIFRYLAL